MQWRRQGDVWRDGTERGDGVEQSAAVADGPDAELPQILARQPAQNLRVNIVVSERGRILFEPDLAQSLGHIHRNCGKNRKPHELLQPQHSIPSRLADGRPPVIRKA